MRAHIRPGAGQSSAVGRRSTSGRSADTLHSRVRCHGRSSPHPDAGSSAPLDHPAAERDVERDEVLRVRAAQPQQLLLGREQVPLGVEHLEVVRDALDVAGVGELRRSALRDRARAPARRPARRDSAGRRARPSPRGTRPGSCARSRRARCCPARARRRGCRARRPRLKIGVVIDGPAFHVSPSRPTSVFSAADANPHAPVSEMFGKNAARAAPMFASAARRRSSAARMSGRASSSSEGSPVRAASCRSAALSGSGAGSGPATGPPTSTSSRLFTCAWTTPQRGAAPPRACASSDSAGGGRAPR